MSLVNELIAVADGLEQQNELAAALEKWRQLSNLGETAFASWHMGRNLMLQGRLDEAIELLEAAVKKYPSDPDVCFMLGFSYKRQNRLVEARESLQTGLQLREWSSAQIVLGEIYRQLGDPDQARVHFEAGLKQEPENAEAWYGLGLIFRDLDRQQAIACFQRAIACDRNDAAAHRELGLMLSETGKSEEAVSSLQAAISLNAKDVWAYSYLASALKRLRRLSEAEAACRSAVQLQPHEPFFWCSLGDVLALEGRWGDAERSYLAALQRDIGHYLSNLRYGQFLNRRGYPAKAIAYIERALDADPENKKISDLLTELRKQTTS